MRRLLFLPVVLTMLLAGNAFAETAFNAQGSAVAPCVTFNWFSNNQYELPSVKLTNISSVPVQCKVTFYDDDGNKIVSPVTTYGSGAVIGTSNEFEIPAKSTRTNQLNRPTTVVNVNGYVVIEWKSTSDPQLRKALIGGVRHHHLKRTSGVTSHSTPIVLINSGQPF